MTLLSPDWLPGGCCPGLRQGSRGELPSWQSPGDGQMGKEEAGRCGPRVARLVAGGEQGQHHFMHM